MSDKLLAFATKKPLVFLLLVAGFLRIISVVFSQGYYAHDDHFLVIGVAQDWVWGLERANWFTDDPDKIVNGRNIIYPGLHYLLFNALDGLKIHSVEVKMFLVRLLNAAYSLLVIVFSYKLGLLFTSQYRALLIGLLTASVWCIPFISVHTLIEWPPVPLLLYVAYVLTKEVKGEAIPWYTLLSCGILLGLSFSIRYQTILVGLGYGLGVLYFKNWKTALLLISGFLIYFLPIHGYAEYLMCHRPFGFLHFYITYNLENAHTYFSEPWFLHLVFLNVLVLPPLGLLFTYGAFKLKKERVILFLGFFFFFAYHSYFPNKQERFIFTILPHFILLGLVGISEVVDQSSFWKKRPNMMKWCIGIFCALNFYFLVFMTPFYSKQARCEVMKYIRTQNPDVDCVIAENTLGGGTLFLPDFYAGKPIQKIPFTERDKIEELKTRLANNEKQPDFILFENEPGKEFDESRLENLKTVFPTLTFSGKIEGSFMDHFRHKLNKVVKNYDFYVYQIN